MDKPISIWLRNERGAPYAYRLPSGEIVRVANASYLLIWHQRRVRAAARERNKREGKHDHAELKNRMD